MIATLTVATRFSAIWFHPRFVRFTCRLKNCTIWVLVFTGPWIRTRSYEMTYINCYIGWGGSLGDVCISWARWFLSLRLLRLIDNSAGPASCLPTFAHQLVFKDWGFNDIVKFKNMRQPLSHQSCLLPIRWSKPQQVFANLFQAAEYTEHLW